MRGSGSTDMNHCYICGKESSSRCTNCRKVWYCSRPHQKEDWSRHKKDCFPGAVMTSSICGRYLSATRNIPGGAIILKEKPLFSAPNGKNGAFLLCLGCYGIVQMQQTPICVKCWWPLHKECTQNKDHTGNECGIFSDRGITPSTREENIYDKILVLRGCLLKCKDANKWELLGQLQDHRDDRLGTIEGASLSKTMVDFVLNKCGLSSTLSATEVDHVLGCAVVNAYVTEDNLTTSPSFQAGSFVFWNGSMPAHDCRPNCKWTIGRGGELRLWSLRDIKEGDSLCHCYAWGGTGTLERQRHLLKSKFFSCSCIRCQDPAELGSFFSGLRCKDDSCLGLVLSLDPMKLGSTWACNVCKNSTITELEVEAMIQELRETHSSITVACPSPVEMGADWREILQQLENFNETVLIQTRLSSTHFLVQEVEQDILVRVSHILGQDTEEFEHMERDEWLHWAGRLITLSRKCLALLDKVGPGMSTHSGRQHYYLQQGLGILIMDQIKIQTDSGNSASSTEQKKKLRQDIEEWQEIRRKGVHILEQETPGREEWMLGRAMIDSEETL